MPRPRKPTEELLRAGTYRADRHAGNAPARLVPATDGSSSDLLEALDALLERERPSWITDADDPAVRLLRERLQLRADLAAQAEAGDVAARRDLLALDRLIDDTLDALGLTTRSRQRHGIAEPATPTSALALLQAKAADRQRRRPAN